MNPLFRGLGLAAALALTGGVGAAVTGEPETESHTDFVPTADKPLRVVLVGDSFIDDLAPGLKAGFKATGVAKVRNENMPGLTTAFDWRGYWPLMLAARKPHVIVVEVGAWDRPFNDFYPDFYRALVNEAMGILTSRGADVIWLGVPPLPLGKMQPWERTSLNRTFRKEAAKREHKVHYLNLGDVVGGANGEFVEHLPTPSGGLERVRKPPDNAHFCAAGAARVAGAVLGDVRDRWDVPKPAKGWKDGAWIFNRRYVPPEPCFP